MAVWTQVRKPPAVSAAPTLMTSKKEVAPSDWKEALSRAVVGRNELNSVTDGLNKEILVAEEAMRSQLSGVTASVLLSSDEDGEVSLAYGKYGAEWRLLIEKTGPGGEGVADVVPLPNATRQVRVRAVEHLPALIKKMAAIIEADLSEVRSAKDKVADFAELVKNEMPF